MQGGKAKYDSTSKERDSITATMSPLVALAHGKALLATSSRYSNNTLSLDPLDPV